MSIEEEICPKNKTESDDNEDFLFVLFEIIFKQ